MKLPQWVPGIGVWVVIGAVYAAAAFLLNVQLGAIVLASVVALVPTVLVIYVLGPATNVLPERLRRPVFAVVLVAIYLALVGTIAVLTPPHHPADDLDRVE